MTRVRWRRTTVLILMATSSSAFVLSSATSSAAATTYATGSVHFQAAFPSTPTRATATKAQIKNDLSGISGVISDTGYASGVAASALFSGASVPKPNAFGVDVITFSSTSTTRTVAQEFASDLGAKKETVDGRTAYRVVGNVGKLSQGTSVPDKSATEGFLVVIDGKSLVDAQAVTKTSSATTSFLGSLKVLS